LRKPMAGASYAVWAADRSNFTTTQVCAHSSRHRSSRR
jgi:hypothetical protein